MNKKISPFGTEFVYGDLSRSFGGVFSALRRRLSANRKMPRAGSPKAFLYLTGAIGVLSANADYIGLAHDHNRPRTRAVAGDVALAMAIPANEPLLVKPVGVLGDTGQVYRFIG